MTNAIVPHEQAVVNVQRVANIVRALYSGVFKPKVDYGTIPGTGDKPTLLLPGMEKLMRALNAVPVYREVCVIRDYDKPLFHYEYECTLIDADSGVPIPGGRAIALATSMEGKWRWRKAERTCPTCGAAAIIKGKAEYGGGWVCFAKRGGCGAKFREGDPAIEGQDVGRIENPDIFDQINTIAKIAQKRALGSAVKGAANVSELFTVDLDDLTEYSLDAEPPRHTDEATGEIVTVTKPAPAPAPTPPTDNVFADLPQYDAPPAPAPAPAPNGLTQAGINSLVLEAGRKGFSEEQVKAALAVNEWSEYAGTFADARATIKKLAAAAPRNPAPIPETLFGGE